MYVAVVTGASMGIGEEFARQLAARRTNLVLVARSADRLSTLAAELEQRHGVRVVTFPCDLAREGSAAQVAAFLKEKGLYPTWLVNNAGFGGVGALDSMEEQRLHDMMMVNMVSLVELTWHLLPMLRLNRDARIINVASTAAFQPVPFLNVYAASKVFVLHFSEALTEELRGTDVKVLALCPGPTPTGFAENAAMNPDVFDKGQSAADVVRMALRASDQGRAILIAQRRVLIFLQRLLPRWFIRRAAAFVAQRVMPRVTSGGE